MANRHYGKIGDIWKHLPLAEILEIEKPRYYWETHAGSAQYLLTHSWERDYGIYYFFNEANKIDSFNTSTYFHLLNQYKREDGDLSIYPGSPLIAMTLLQASAEYMFCDLDSESLDTINEAAQRLQISDITVRCIQNDGITEIANFASTLSVQDAVETFVQIDPYQPLEKSKNGMNSIDLFCDLTLRGVKTLFWYGYDLQNKNNLWSAIKITFDEKRLDISNSHLWCGEINLSEINNSNFSLKPGVMGCGILCSNLSNQTSLACTELGKKLQNLYENAFFPSGESGAIEYRTVSL